MLKRSKLRRQIAWNAAQLMHGQPQLRHSDAIRLAAARLCPLGAHPRDLPTAEDLQQQLDQLRPTAESEWYRRFEFYLALLQPLAEVQQNPARHPEGDALYHSLQVFDLASDAVPYDEELLTAALLHDVGKAIDRRDHVAAGLAALEGMATPRTLWFIENLHPAHALAEGSLGARARRRLLADDDFDQLQLLAECDHNGCVRGAVVPEVDEAVAYIRTLDHRHDL